MIDRPDTSLIQADFDRLAAFSNDGWDHNSQYHRFLLRHVPQHCQQALEIGCGSGAFARLLATRSKQVLALYMSPQMIQLAQQRYVCVPFRTSPTLPGTLTRCEDQKAPVVALFAHVEKAAAM